MQKCFEKLLVWVRSVSFLNIMILGILVLVVDQFSKAFIEKTIYCAQSLRVNSFLDIVNVHNYGMTFGLFSGEVSSIFLAIFAILVIIFLVYWIYRDRSIMFGGLIVIFGAIGNIIDRLYYGYVIDFIDFHIGRYHWPAFNVADIFIVFGNISILLIILLDNRYKDCVK